MATFTSHSPEETRALGWRWGQAASPGTVFGLTGDLGSGKTQLVKGIAEGLGCSGKVRSPTFALLHHYAGGRLPFYHLDLYRLSSVEEIERAGLADYFACPDGVVAVEWFERWRPVENATPSTPGGANLARIFLRIGGENERTIVYDHPGL